MAKKKKKAEFKLKLEIDDPRDLSGMANTCEQQVATVMACEDWANQPKVQDAAKNVQADVKLLRQLVIDHGNAAALLTSLATKRDSQAFSLRLNHESLQTEINLAGKGDKKALLAWGGTIVTRNTVPKSADPPLNVMVETTDSAGTVVARCKADPAAYAYAFQWGENPDDPDTWASPRVESKASLTLSGLPIGHKLYLRIAIYRRGVGQGAWSDLVQVVVH